MGVRSTTSCNQYGHPEFELEVGDLGDELTTSLVRYLEGAVSRGTRFEPGQTIQFGFQVLEVRGDARGLTLFAPQRSLASAILATLRQKFVTESFGLSEALDFPSPTEEALTCTNLRSLGHGAFIRDEGGWRAFCLDDGHDHDDVKSLVPRPLCELAAEYPILDLFVGMPIGTTVNFDPGGVRSVLFGNREIVPEPGSFVSALGQREGWPLVSDRRPS